MYLLVNRLQCALIVLFLFLCQVSNAIDAVYETHLYGFYKVVLGRVQTLA